MSLVQNHVLGRLSLVGFDAQDQPILYQGTLEVKPQVEVGSQLQGL